MRLLLIFTTLAGSVAFSQIINQFAPDAAQINYVSNLNQGDSALNITNGGAFGAFLSTSFGDICANIYVFDPAQ
jgi:hypothetical protein